MMINNDAKNTGQVELETDFNKNKNISTTKFLQQRFGNKIFTPK